MNWGLIGWFAGIVATIYGLKFVLELFKSLMGKDAREDIMGALGKSIHNTNKRITKKLKEKANERKQKKQDENRAVVIIR